MFEIYPTNPSQRDRWILQHRGPKTSLDVFRPYAFLWEEEPGSPGVPPATGPSGAGTHACGAVASETLALPGASETLALPTATIFLTNRECPFRCLMCDLWQNTLDAQVPSGAIVTQILHALKHLAPARQIKLYNAGSFFDPHAIPPEDDAEIAGAVRGFDRVIVECHPAFLRGQYAERALRFQASLRGQLEIAIGLETVHAPTLEKLNKRMTVESFREAADFLQRHGIDLRVFILLRPPFLTEREGVEWACRSLDVAAECGAKVCSIIPTRGGNGAMEALGEAYQPPKLRSLEATVEYGLSRHRFRVYADLWEVEKFSGCECSESRAARLAEINRTQRIPAAICCPRCTENG